MWKKTSQKFISLLYYSLGTEWSLVVERFLKAYVVASRSESFVSEAIQSNFWGSYKIPAFRWTNFQTSVVIYAHTYLHVW